MFGLDEANWGLFAVLLLLLAMVTGVAVALATLAVRHERKPSTPALAIRKPRHGGQPDRPDSGWVQQWLLPGTPLLSGGVLAEGLAGVQLDGDIELVDDPEHIARLGDEIAARFISPRVNAVNNLAEALDAIMPGEGTGFTALTCFEADALARALAEFGHFYSAVNVIAGHCHDDDGGDAHGYIRLLDDETPDALEEAAEVYVRRLMGDTEAQPRGYGRKVVELGTAREILATAIACGADDEATKDLIERETDVVMQLRQELGASLDDLDQEAANGIQPWHTPTNN